MTPQRIQLRRTKGWRLPVLACNVARPTYWGNPFRVGDTTPVDWHPPFAGVTVRDREHAVGLLRHYLSWRRDQGPNYMLRRPFTGPNFPWESQIRQTLAGRDLACWCPLPEPGQPDHCHAAVLLELANPAPNGREGAAP